MLCQGPVSLTVLNPPPLARYPVLRSFKDHFRGIMRLYKLMIEKKRGGPELLVCLSQQAQYGITFLWGKWYWGIFGWVTRQRKPCRGACGFASEASKVQMVPAAEGALDLRDPWVVGRCEGLPVGVETPSPRLKPHAAREVPLAGSRALAGTVSSPGRAAGSQRVQPGAVIRSSPGSARVMQRGREEPAGGGGASRSSCTSGPIGSARLSSPRFCSHSCVHSARDPPSDP